MKELNMQVKRPLQPNNQSKNKDLQQEITRLNSEVKFVTEQREQWLQLAQIQNIEVLKSRIEILESLTCGGSLVEQLNFLSFIQIEDSLNLNKESKDSVSNVNIDDDIKNNGPSAFTLGTSLSDNFSFVDDNQEILKDKTCLHKKKKKQYYSIALRKNQSVFYIRWNNL